MGLTVKGSAMASITEYIESLLNGENLTFEQAMNLQDMIFEGQVPEAQVAAFLTAMRAKGATASEIAGLARSLRSHAVKIDVETDNLVDTCGTGGAAIKTFNISTACALVAAGAGVHVAKHGNRGITSNTGSADVLSELGVKIDASVEKIAQCISQAHIGFMFAPCFHPAMKYVQPIRKALGFRTVFNILGPLANPAGASAQVLGVADKTLMQPIIEALQTLGTRYAMVVHSQGLDEISIAGATEILELKDGQVTSRQLTPEELGMKSGSLEQLKVDNSAGSAAMIKKILSGEERGPARDIVLINAAAAIIAGQLAEDFIPAVKLAEQSIDQGKAQGALEKLIEISNS